MYLLVTSLWCIYPENIKSKKEDLDPTTWEKVYLEIIIIFVP